MTETVSPDMAGHGRYLGGLQHRPGRKRLLALMLPAGTVSAHLLTGERFALATVIVVQTDHPMQTPADHQ